MSLPRILTTVDSRHPSFRERDIAFRILIDEFTSRMNNASLGGPEVIRARHLERGKLLPRDRVNQLLDPGSPFLELSPLAANGIYDDDAPGAGLITGIGSVSGHPTMIIANDATVKGGTYYPLT